MKRLLLCDPTFGPKFLKQFQVHYDMNLDVYQEGTNVNLCIGHEWIESILVETLEPI
jgi:hypothetical protein